MSIKPSHWITDCLTSQMDLNILNWAIFPCRLQDNTKKIKKGEKLLWDCFHLQVKSQKGSHVAKRLRKPKSRSPSDFCRIYALGLCYSQRIYSEGVTRFSTHQVQWDENLAFWHSKCPTLSSENNLYFPLPICRSTFFFVDHTVEGILSSFISSICFNISTFAFLLPFFRVGIHVPYFLD